MHAHCLLKANQKVLHLSHKWTYQSVIQETQKANLKIWIVNTYQVKAGSFDIFHYYQPGLTGFIKSLSEEVIAEARETATRWNNDGGPEDARAW